MKKLFLFILFPFAVETISAQYAAIDSSRYPKLTVFTTQQDQANMMQQLGIKKLRPGKSGNDKDPNHANYDEALANPCPQLPDVLTLKKGCEINYSSL